jgi:hypothetical protein
VEKLGKPTVSKKNKQVVEHPTELLRSLGKGIQINGPIKQELTKASAIMTERKLEQSKDS